MNRSACWMIASLALCWALTGCGKPKPAPQAAPAAAEPVAVAPAAEPASPALALPVADPTTVVAKVNEKDITEGDVQKVLDTFMKQMGGKIPPEQLQTALPRLRERIVEELIMRSIMLDEVAKNGISLSDAEFDKVKAELAEELPEGTTLETYMAETGTSEAEMREQMAVRKMVLAKAESLPKPTDEEIQKYFDENKENFNQNETVAAAHILIKVDPNDDDAAKAAKRERLEGLRKQLLEGADFAELAKANSDCPSASAGGDLGTFGRGQMVPEFDAAAFSQPTGSVGDIVETQFGYHLIKVTDHQQAKALDFAEVKPRISDILFSQKQQEAVRDYVEGLRKGANVQRFDKAPAAESVVEAEVEGAAPVAPVGEESAPEVAPAPEQAEPAAEKAEALADEIVAEVETGTAETQSAAAEAAAAARDTAETVVEKAAETIPTVEAEVESAPVPSAEVTPADPEVPEAAKETGEPAPASAP